MRVAIIGAGVAGLGTAVALAHDGHDIVLIERDATPLPSTPDEAFEWNRKSAPQVRHSRVPRPRTQRAARPAPSDPRRRPRCRGDGSVHRKEDLSQFEAFIRSLVEDGLFLASMKDVNVSRAWMRTFNLLTTPQGVFTDPEVMRVVMEFWNDRDNREKEPIEGPTREQILEVIGATG